MIAEHNYVLFTFPRNKDLSYPCSQSNDKLDEILMLCSQGKGVLLRKEESITGIDRQIIVEYIKFEEKEEKTE